MFLMLIFHSLFTKGLLTLTPKRGPIPSRRSCFTAELKQTTELYSAMAEPVNTVFKILKITLIYNKIYYKYTRPPIFDRRWLS